jgi:hypothetical protein
VADAVVAVGALPVDALVAEATGACAGARAPSCDWMDAILERTALMPVEGPMAPTVPSMPSQSAARAVT